MAEYPDTVSYGGADITGQTGNDLIDATQSAIIDAAENVSEVLDKVNPAAANHAEVIPFYADVEFWVGMAFILTLIILARPGIKFIKTAMQKKIASVISEIDEAQKLRDDAQKLLAEYEKKFRHTDEETKSIMADAEKNIENQKKNELAKMKERSVLREKEAKRRITGSTQKAIDEINLSVSGKAVRLAKESIAAYIDKAGKSKLIDEAIADLDKLL